MSETLKTLSEADECFDLNFTELQEIILTAGKDGTPCTHSWDGTTLTVTSASGTSSADLKGTSIADIRTQFYISSSDTSPSDGEWINEIPNEVNGKYLWIRIVTIYDNGTVTHSVPVRDPICERLTAHESNSNNPHSVTISQIGAAPSGYGLGTTAKATTDLNNCLACGWYAFSSDCANAPFSYGVMETMNRYDTGYVQIAYDTGLANASHNGAIAKRVLGTGVTNWSSWEFENPPMKLGTEYRTTKRYLGKPVYIKAIDCGDAPQSSGKSVSHGISNCRVLKCYGTTGDGIALPYCSASGARVHISAHSSAVVMYASYDTAMTNVVAVIEYWKSTD